MILVKKRVEQEFTPIFNTLVFVWSAVNDGQSGNRRNITPYITLSTPGDDLKFPRPNLHFAKKKKVILKPPTLQWRGGRAIPQPLQRGDRPASFSCLPKGDCSRHPCRSQHAQVPRDRHSAQPEAHKDPRKWSKCSNLTVNNDTCFRGFIMKIRNTWRDSYGAIRKIFAFSFQDDLGHHCSNYSIYHFVNGP